MSFQSFSLECILNLKNYDLLTFLIDTRVFLSLELLIDLNFEEFFFKNITTYKIYYSFLLPLINFVRIRLVNNIILNKFQIMDVGLRK